MSPAELERIVRKAFDTAASAAEHYSPEAAALIRKLGSSVEVKQEDLFKMTVHRRVEIPEKKEK